MQTDSQSKHPSPARKATSPPKHNSLSQHPLCYPELHGGLPKQWTTSKQREDLNVTFGFVPPEQVYRAPGVGRKDVFEQPRSEKKLQTLMRDPQEM